MHIFLYSRSAILFHIFEPSSFNKHTHTHTHTHTNTHKHTHIHTLHIFTHTRTHTRPLDWTHPVGLSDPCNELNWTITSDAIQGGFTIFVSFSHWKGFSILFPSAWQKLYFLMSSPVLSKSGAHLCLFLRLLLLCCCVCCVIVVVSVVAASFAVCTFSDGVDG